MQEAEHDAVVKRINELARKAKSQGLTDLEITERNDLRRKYIDSFKASLRSQLDNIQFVDEADNR